MLLCAVKKIELHFSFNEIEVGYKSKLNDQYLVKYYDMFESDNNYYVVMEYFENGDLFNLIRKQQKKNKRIKILVFLIFV
jgi:serine/threonine protein kinase